MPAGRPDPCSLRPYRRATSKALKTHPSSPRGKRGVVSLVFLDALSGSSSEVTTRFCLWWEKPEALFLTLSPRSIFPTVPLQDPGRGQFRGAERVQPTVTEEAGQPG